MPPSEEAEAATSCHGNATNYSSHNMSLQIAEHIEQLQPVRRYVTCTLGERRSMISASLSYCVFFQTVSNIKEIWYGSLKPIKIKNEREGLLSRDFYNLI
jgi:hypothetical protein